MILLAALLLCGCGSSPKSETSAETPGTVPEAVNTETPEPTPMPTPEPTPTPVPELTFPDGSVHRADETELNLSKLSHRDVQKTVELLKQMPDLHKIDLGTDGAWTGIQPELTEETASLE